MEIAAPLTLTETVYRAMRADLLTCRVPPGGKLKIADLCTSHGSSLGAVREALSRLTAEGLVVCLPQRGFQAAAISMAELKDLTLARVEIEALCLSMAVKQGDLAWEERLLGISHRLARTEKRAPGDAERLSDAWALAHGAFHEALVAACGSLTLLQIRRQLYAQSERYRRLSIPLAETERDVDQEHRDLVTAALDRDVPRALDLMKAHIEQTTKILLHALNDRIRRVA
ncbi:GntR family transcriptional regulator [Lichenicoccus sp.]|uniref:GntR family transcriptional regulator n=1 Tax=Lichenicoccus sp. TaxID=2781899 RepID=UPI003D0C9F88